MRFKAILVWLLCGILVLHLYQTKQRLVDVWVPDWLFTLLVALKGENKVLIFAF